MDFLEKAKLESVFNNQVDETADLLLRVFKQDLLGLYLYGSATHKGIQNFSDIDLLAITKRKLTNKEHKTLVEKLLQISKEPGKRAGFSVELTLIEDSQVNPWRYPPKFFFQFGEWMRQDFESKVKNPTHSDDMPDLAVLITLVRLSGKIVKGLSPKNALPEVPFMDFMSALHDKVPSLRKKLTSDTRNTLLTLARIWTTLNTDCICSKMDSADWAIAHLPKSIACSMERAKAITLGTEENNFIDLEHQLSALVDFMSVAIEKQYEALKKEVKINRKILLKF